MLELFGAGAVSWTIEKVERKAAAPAEKQEKITDRNRTRNPLITNQLLYR